MTTPNTRLTIALQHTDPQPLAQLTQDTMLPITNEDNAANLNAAFVTDNSLEVADGKGNVEQSSEEEIAKVVEIDGNIEAETNKSVNSSEIKAGMENLENTTTAEELTTTAIPTTQYDVEDEALTIENNEETVANNSPNESSNTDAATAEAAAADDDATNVEEDAANETTTVAVDDLRTELDVENINETASSESAGIDEVTEPVKSVADSAEWLGEDAVATPGADIDVVDNLPNEKRYANYANNKNREDLSSSDDEVEGDAVQMNPGFDSEWGDLKEDLARASNEQNDLSNEIDAYEAVPVDLSNDIAVNDIAAANPDFPINPDAEVFDVNALKNPGAMPMFEKLTISETANPAK